LSSISPQPERFAEFSQTDLDQGVVMLNLLRFRDQAEYPAESSAAPCSGREAYARYMAAVQPKVAEVGGEIVWTGEVESALIAPSDEDWDEVFLVRYPSRRAFLSLVMQPDYQATAVHRTAALADSRLIATQPRNNTLDQRA